MSPRAFTKINDYRWKSPILLMHQEGLKNFKVFNSKTLKFLTHFQKKRQKCNKKSFSSVFEEKGRAISDQQKCNASLQLCNRITQSRAMKICAKFRAINQLFFIYKKKLCKFLTIPTNIIRSPASSLPSCAAAPPGMIFVIKMPSLPSMCWLPTPPAIEKPSPDLFFWSLTVISSVVASLIVEVELARMFSDEDCSRSACGSRVELSWTRRRPIESSTLAPELRKIS